MDNRTLAIIELIINYIDDHLSVTNAILIIFLVWIVYKYRVINSLINKNPTVNELENALAESSQLTNIGIIGTFIGICFGLYFFNPNQLESSIVMLLESMRFAFVTSVIGMGSSYFLRQKVNSKMRTLPEHEITSEPVDLIRYLNSTLKEGINELNKTYAKQNQTFNKSLETYDTTINKYQKEANNILKNISKEYQNAVWGTNQVMKEAIEKVDKQMEKELEKTFNIFAGKLASLSEKFISDYEKMTTHLKDALNEIEKIKNK